MSFPHGTNVADPVGDRIGELKRETRDSAALILVVLAVVVTVSFIGLKIA